MTTDRELMQQALDAMLHFPNDISDDMFESIRVLRARLAQPEQQHSEQWWRHEVSNAWAEGYEKGRASVKQPEQEPVAWADKYDLDREGHDFWVSRQQPAKNGVPLYTAPPQRDETPAKAVEWQGLTMEEMDALVEEQSGWPVEMVGHVLICAAEAKLREKNT